MFFERISERQPGGIPNYIGPAGDEMMLAPQFSLVTSNSFPYFSSESLE